MQCNIDAKGKAVRLVSGLAVLLVGLVLLGLILSGVLQGRLAWAAAAAALLSGAFQVFEARAGWCVLRAMGFKTPI